MLPYNQCLVNAIFDRIINAYHKITMNGNPLRKKRNFAIALF